MLRAAAAASGRVYIRLSALANAAPLAGSGEGFTVLRHGTQATIVAVGPLADAVIEAASGLDTTVLYASTVRPFDRQTLRATLGAPVVVLVEPYLAGTSVPEVASALSDLPHRVLGLGVSREELRRYGTPQEHQAAHGLDPTSLRERIAGFIDAVAVSRHRLPARSMA